MFAKPCILLLLAELTLGIQLYISPVSNKLPAASTISPKQARVVVSHQLGLDAFDPLEDLDLSTERLLGNGFVGEGDKNALLLTVSEDIARDVIPSTLKPAYKLLNPPSAALEISRTVASYIRRASHAYTTILSDSSSLLTPSSPPPSRLLDIFTITPSPSTEAFLSEINALASIVDTSEQGVFGAFELNGLSSLAAEFGRTSEQYQLAADTFRAFIQSALANVDANRLNLVILTYPGSGIKRQSSTSTSDEHEQIQQQQPPQSPFPPPTPSPQLPIGGVSTCHSSIDACTNITNACSGRGECAQVSKAGKTCFVCQCSATLDSRGRREDWVGDACERLDVSAPFTLITGTVIGILIIIFGSVALLYSVGDQQLPPTLTASASGRLKRE